MRFRSIVIAMLALTPIAGYADDDAHQGMMPGMTHGKAEGGRSGNRGHAQLVGKPGDPNRISRTIQVRMSDDMKFAPAKVSVRRGETVKFVVRNVGQIKHEMIIGSMAQLKEHAALMRKMPGMEHDEPNQVSLDPGKSGELIWQFTKAGTINFACLQPGHFEAGMMGNVSVE